MRQRPALMALVTGAILLMETMQILWRILLRIACWDAQLGHHQAMASPAQYCSPAQLTQIPAAGTGGYIAGNNPSTSAACRFRLTVSLDQLLQAGHSYFFFPELGFFNISSA